MAESKKGGLVDLEKELTCSVSAFSFIRVCAYVLWVARWKLAYGWAKNNIGNCIIAHVSRMTVV